MLSEVRRKPNEVEGLHILEARNGFKRDPLSETGES
jgi:hypothetical protein